MSSLKFKKLGSLAICVTVLALVAGQGCSSGDDSQAQPQGGAPGASGGSNRAGANSEAGGDNTPAEGGAAGSPGGGDSGTGNTGNAGNTEAGSGGEAGTPVTGPGCTGTNGCYSCTPTTTSQFENGCVAGGCPDTFTDKLSKIKLVGTL